jgi:hypothetical protein
MPNPSLSLSTPSTGQRRLRPAAPRGMGGASSLLRLSRSAETRLPSGAALSDWAERAASMLDLTPMMVGPQSSALRPAAVQQAGPFMLGVQGVRS